MKTALVCIAKNEDNYIDEWIEYHLMLGFDRIFVYQNDWRYSGPHTENPNVEFIAFDGEAMQMNAYNDFIGQHAQEYDFAAFWDVDEFLCLKTYSNVDDFLKRFVSFYAVCVNWRVFGDNGLTSVEGGNYSLLNRFTKCQSVLDRHVKTILNLKKTGTAAKFVNPHFVDLSLRPGFAVSADMKAWVRGPWNYGSECGTVQLNHYHSKTWPEFVEKMARGKADTPLAHPGYSYKNSDFMLHNFNDIEDTTVKDFFNGRKKLNDRLEKIFRPGVRAALRGVRRS